MTMAGDRAVRPSRRRLALAAVLTVIAAGSFVLIWLKHVEPARSALEDDGPSIATAEPTRVGEAADTSRTAPAFPSASDDFSESLQDRAWSRLVAEGEAAVQQGPESVHAFVRRLFKAMDALPSDDRLAVIFAFFQSGVDVRFGRTFVVGTKGFLEDWPTLRVALLDYLSQRDGPGARVLAESILRQRPQEPGEWTLALRELARGHTAASWPELVTERLGTFLSDSDWAGRGEPSWLEGFDVVVAGRSTTFLTNLAGLAGSEDPGRRAAQFAAFLATDRLVQVAPIRTLAALNDDPALFATRPNLRAGLFGRADVRSPDQLRELERYLRRTDVSPSERESFGALFPLYDLAVSNNILTSSPSRSMSDMLAHDRAAIARIALWLKAPELQAWSSVLRTSRARIAEQVGQTEP